MPVLKDLNQLLLQKFPENNNRFRYLETGAQLPEGWVLQTPDIWGMSRSSIPAGHSAAFAREFYNMMIEAQQYILISNLANPFSDGQGPDGDFLNALRSAITYLGQAGRKVAVNVLIGAAYLTPVTPASSAKKILGSLTRDLVKIPNAKVSVSVLASGSALTWNHSKLLVVDARSAITGGHNLYHTKYLAEEPVFDLSMKLKGPIAVNAHNYFISAWKLYTGFANKFEAVYVPPALAGKKELAAAPGPFAVDAAQLEEMSAGQKGAPAGIPVMAIGRLGSSLDNEPGDEALLYLVEQARETIRISQASLQSVFLPGVWWGRLLSALARFIFHKRGQVFIVLSSSTAKDGYQCMGNFSDVYNKILSEMMSLPGAPVESQLRGLLNACLHVEHIAFSADNEWASGAGIANHAKMFLVDDELFYIGSHNAYPGSPGGLAEFGFIIEDKAAAGQLLDRYWNKLWKYSESRVELSTGKAEYARGEAVDVYVKVDGEMRSDSIRFINESGQEEWWTWTGNIREGRIANQYVVSDKYAQHGQTIRIEYLTSGGGIRQVRRTATFRIRPAAASVGVVMSTGKADYVQNDSIDVWIKVDGAIRDDSIRILDESGREEWWTWTGNIREGRITNSYKVTDKYHRTGQKLRIDYLYDGNNTRKVRQTVYCNIKPMVVTVRTNKLVYKVDELVSVFVQVSNAMPYNDSVTFHRPDGREDSWMWTGNVMNGYIRQTWKAPAHLKGQTVTVRYLYDGAGKKWIIAQASFRIE